MILDQKLFASVSAAAGRVMVDQVTIGLGYTAVTTSDGDIGIAATGVALNGSHAGNLDVVDYEGRPAIDLLEGILVPDPMLRTMALALINALNHNRTMQFPEDLQNRILFDRFGILGGARVAMVGYFPPLVRFLEKKQIPLSVIDNARGLGDKKNLSPPTRQLGRGPYIDGHQHRQRHYGGPPLPCRPTSGNRYFGPLHAHATRGIRPSSHPHAGRQRHHRSYRGFESCPSRWGYPHP